MIHTVKNLMNGLSAQYAGDYLSSAEKDNFLDHVPIIKSPTTLVNESTSITIFSD